MKLTIESTKEIATINGKVPARLWKGRTESGVECILFVTRILVPVHSGIGPAFSKPQDQAEFERELKEDPQAELIIGGYELRGPIDIRLII